MVLLESQANTDTYKNIGISVLGNEGIYTSSKTAIDNMSIVENGHILSKFFIDAQVYTQANYTDFFSQNLSMLTQGVKKLSFCRFLYL